MKRLPVIHAEFPFEGTGRVWLEAPDREETERMWQWLRRRPEYRPLCELLEILRDEQPVPKLAEPEER